MPTWDPEALVLSYFTPGPLDGEGDQTDPVEQSLTFTQAEIDTALVERLTPAATPVPEEVTPRQFRLAMIQGGVTPSQIETVIAAIPDATQRLLAQTEWEFASSVKRSHPLVAQFGRALGKTEVEIDQIFIVAKAIGG